MRIDIIVNGYLRMAAIDECAELIQKALVGGGVECTAVTADVYYEQVLREGGKGRCAVMWDKSYRLCAELEGMGVKLFNSSHCIEVCDDKAKTAVCLKGKVAMPTTIVPPITYGRKLSIDYLKSVGDKLGYPYVLKPAFGSLGMGVGQINSLDEAIAVAPDDRAIFQSFVRESFGRDIRAYVVGGKVIAAMERHSQGGLCANIASGGSGRELEITPQIETQALAAAKAVGADFAGIDMCCDELNSVIEVNSNALFGELNAVTGVRIHEEIARLVMQYEK